MENFEKVQNIVIESKCVLLTTFEDFEAKRKMVLDKSYQFVRIDFIGICGHNSSAVFTNFKTRQTGIRCKDCVRKDKTSILKNKAKQSNNIEAVSVDFLEQYLIEQYDIIRTKEGCKADLIIKNKYDNKYIPLQLKATNSISKHKMYSFRYINKNYDNMLIICICISEKKIWVIPYDDIKHLSNLNISSNSKYNKYLVSDNTKIYEVINKYSDKYSIDTIDDLLEPTAILQKREQEYVKKREKYINFLDYKYPDVQNTPTDFIVNNKKVQEKVAGVNKCKGTNVLSVILASNNGKKDNGNRQFRTYRLGENDYYWFHSSIDDRFWIVPEIVLYEKGYLSKEDETKCKKSIYLSYNTEWIKKYEYDYNNINKVKVQELFH
jgi:hypothetical protein